MDEIVMYVIQGSTDQTEGRTGYVDRELFYDFDKAVEVLKSGKWGVQGLAMHSDLVQRTLIPQDGRWHAEDIKLWAYHKSRDGKWRHGWVDDRDVEELHDPQYKEYIRLKKIYED